MALPFLNRALISPLLLLNFALYVIVLSIAGWAADMMMDGVGVQGNVATPNLTIFSLIAGVVGIASIFSGLHLIRTWHEHTILGHVAAATASALIAWLLLLLAFGFACKEINVGGSGTNLKFLEAFVIILTATQALYLFLLHGVLLTHRPSPMGP